MLLVRLKQKYACLDIRVHNNWLPEGILKLAWATNHLQTQKYKSKYDTIDSLGIPCILTKVYSRTLEIKRPVEQR